MAPVTIDGLEARQGEIRARLEEINSEYAGTRMTDESRTEWNSLNEEYDSNDEVLEELRARLETIEARAGAGRTERGATFQTARAGRHNGGDPFDLVRIRNESNSRQHEAELLRENAHKVLELARFPHAKAARAREDVQAHVANLIDGDASPEAEVAHRIIATGSEIYQRAFLKTWQGAPLTSEESRALSLTTTAGGFAVPYVLDPTIIPTSDGSVNPIRQIAEVKQITSNEWRGVSSAGVTATYRAEAAEAADNAPTLAQPTINPERADVFIPFSIEIDMDWGTMQTEMARLVQQAKDDLEAVKFVTGLGHASTEPQGLLVGATAVVLSAATATFAIADLYTLENALPARFQSRASIVAHKAQYNRVRALDTTGQLYVRLPDARPAELLGYPAYNSTGYVSTFTTGSSAVTIGDFSYYVITDRIGMNAELLPHLLGSNRRPSGQRGLFFWWRNSGGVIHFNAFRTLKAL